MHVFSLYVIMLDVAPSSPNQTLDSTSLRVGGGKPKSIWVAPAPGSKMPPLETFRLTKEMVQERVKDNVIITTFGNYAFMDFILTWVKRLTDLGVENLLVGAMDVELLEALYRKGVPVFDMGSHMSEIDVGWGSPTFHKIGREKVILIDSMLPFGFELLMCDSDMVWLKNPLPYLARYPEADILTSTDQVTPTVTDERLDNWQEVGGAYNIGMFHWRPTDSAKRLAKEWKEMLLADDNVWDQAGFNDLLHKQLGPPVDDERGLVYAYDGTLKLGLLPASIFCSGHTYFIQAMYQQLRLKPYAVHTTFQIGSEGKRHRLREAMVFYDPPEYYDSPGGFLTFKPSIPKSLLLDGEHNLQTHFSLVNYQMKQIRTALAIASILNRTLVMPPVWCRLDKLWFPHSGIIAGSMTRQPFICPLDHVFEVHTMLKALPVEEYGPGINIREYSFFDNPSTPAQVKDSWLDVQLCQEGSEKCQSNITNTTRVLRFPKHSNEETLTTLLSPLKDVKVIQFSSMQDAFLGFSDKASNASEEKFRKRVKRYVGIWCCVGGHDPGHIYYDMYWDEKPDWKPLPPQTPEDDHPYR
ncbi:putative nucleotide-diphospho-sugar transferase [Helianthus annuus]|nr:putative nucleotide-diphospho-sugar transferase [Helianthus annuus]KAJ0634907.1 putative nucleotide-diphospho-sugar transferase [Helianthus annuus]